MTDALPTLSTYILTALAGGDEMDTYSILERVQALCGERVEFFDLNNNLEHLKLLGRIAYTRDQDSVKCWRLKKARGWGWGKGP